MYNNKKRGLALSAEDRMGRKKGNWHKNNVFVIKMNYISCFAPPENISVWPITYSECDLHPT